MTIFRIILGILIVLILMGAEPEWPQDRTPESQLETQP